MSEDKLIKAAHLFGKGGGGQPPMDDITIERRFGQIESRLGVMDTKLDSLTLHGATKADLADSQVDVMKSIDGAKNLSVGLSASILIAVLGGAISLIIYLAPLMANLPAQ